MLLQTQLDPQLEGLCDCAGLTGTVYGRLQDSGYFFDPVQREVEQQVMPWLLQETQNEVARRNTARCAVALITHDIRP